VMLADTAVTHPPVDIERVMLMDDRATDLGMVKVKTKCGVRLENDILSIGNVTICHIGEGDQRVAGEVTRWYRQTLHSYLIYGLAQPFRHTLDTSKNDMFELAAYTAQTSPQYYEMLKWCVQLAMLKRRDEHGIPIPPEAGPVDEDFGVIMKPIRARDIKFFNDLHWSGPPAGVCEMTLEWWEQRAHREQASCAPVCSPPHMVQVQQVHHQHQVHQAQQQQVQHNLAQLIQYQQAQQCPVQTPPQQAQVHRVLQAH
jgi:hypothetical protein